MKTVFCGLLLAAFCLTAKAQVTHLIDIEQRSIPPPRPFVHEIRLFHLEQGIDRITERHRGRMQDLSLDLITGDRETDSDFFAARRGRSLFRDGLKFSWKSTWREAPLYTWLHDRGDEFEEFTEETAEKAWEKIRSLWKKPTPRTPGSTNELQAALQANIRRSKLMLSGDLNGDIFREDPFVRFKWKLEERPRRYFDQSLTFSFEKWHKPKLEFATHIPFRKWYVRLGSEYRLEGDEREEHQHYGRLFTEIDRRFEIAASVTRPIGEHGLFRFEYDVLGKQCFAIIGFGY